jgi:antitoxin component of MazEF toxin-antitoxin module
MRQIKTKVRKWGNSFGIILPKKVVDTENIKEGIEIDITIHPKNKTTVRDLFGLAKKHPLPKKKDKKSTQEILDEIDRELEPEMFS